MVRGEPPPRPLLIPIIFSLGARLESVPLHAFQTNPTKITNALRQIHNVLKVDGLTCYFDPWLEVEALGYQLERHSDGPSSIRGPHFSSVDELRGKLPSPDSLTARGRIPIACEVIKRLKLMLKDEPALVSSVTGPLTLAQTLWHRSAEQNTAVPLPAELVEFATEVAANVSKSLLDAGADIILLIEKFQPPLSAETTGSYASLVAPIANAVRFYEALPVLMLPMAQSKDAAVAQETLQPSSGWILCPALPDDLPVSLECPLQSGSVVAIALPTGAFGAEQVARRNLLGSLDALLREKRLALLTSGNDLPSDTSSKELSANLTVFRQLFDACNPT